MSSHKVSGWSSQSDLWLLLCKAAMSFFQMCVCMHAGTWVHTCACVEARGCCRVSSLIIGLDLAHLTNWSSQPVLGVPLPLLLKS